MIDPARPRGLTGTVLRGSGLAGTGWVLGQVLNLGFYVVLAHIATPEEFGLVAAGSIVVGAAELFANSGMVAALVQRPDRIEEAANTALIATIGAGFALSLVALALAPLVGAFFQSDQVTEIAAATSVWILLRSATNVPDALMQRRFSFLRRLVVEPLGIVVFGITAVITVANGLGVWGLVLGSTAQRLVVAVAAWLLVGWRPNLSLASVPMWREMIGYGRHVVAAGLLSRLSYETSTALLGRFAGAADLGQFRYAARIAQKPRGLMINAASYVLFPAFSRIAPDRPRLGRAYLRSLRWIALVSIPVGFVMLPLGEPLAVLMFGEPWRPAGYAAMAMFAYVGGRSISSVAGETIKAVGEPRYLPRINGLSAALSISFIIALLPLGLVGVAAATSVSSIGTTIYALHLADRATGIGIRRLVPELWPPLAAATLMVATLLPLEHLLIDAAGREVGIGLVLLAGELALGTAIYLGALAVMAPSSARAIKELPRIARERLRSRRSARPRREDVREPAMSTPPEDAA